MIDELLIACSLKATVILISASGICAIMGRASASARHMVWTVSFAALLLLPTLSRVTPEVGQPIRLPSSQPNGPRLVPSAESPQSPSRAGHDWLAITWLLGAALVLTRFAVGTARAWQITRRAHPLALPDAQVTVLDAGRGAMPMTWGILRPVVLLPSEATKWPAERLRTVLLHELAHIARRDCLTLALGELALACYWFHPLAWWAANRMRRERERACDDRVLAAGVAATDYAHELLEVARSQDGPLAAPAMARASSLEARLRAILDPTVRRHAVSARMASAVFVAALLALLPLASLRLLGQERGLSGVIYDPSGAAVPAAEVSIVNQDSGFKNAIRSGPDGGYSFPDLPSGRYKVTVRQPGFQSYTRDTTVPAAMDVALLLGGIEERLTVTGKRPQSAPNPAPGRIRVGGNVQAARLLSAAHPVYPPRAEAAGISGRVLLHTVVLMDGSVGGVSVLSSPDPELAQAAIDAVKQWRYLPTLLNGKPVEVITTISVNFRLDQ